MASKDWSWWILNPSEEARTVLLSIRESTTWLNLIIRIYIYIHHEEVMFYKRKIMATTTPTSSS